MKGSVVKIFKDIKGFIGGNREFSFLETSLSTTEYPIDLEFTLENEGFYYEPKDEAGIPVKVYSSVGVQYNPTRVAAYGLAHYNRYVRGGSERSLDVFLSVADWFMRQSPEGYWTYTFPWGELQSPWISAMAQGEGISVLVRAWRVSGREDYLIRAIEATKPFTLRIEEGGVRSELSDGLPFLEEYPTKIPDHVLNGFLYAIIGLTDLHRTGRWSPPRGLSPRLFISVLEQHLEDWDIGCWSAYDVSQAKWRIRNPATTSYHRLHVTQLKYLGNYWSSQRLLDKATEWETNAKRPLCRLKAMSLKLMYRAIVRAER